MRHWAVDLWLSAATSSNIWHPLGPRDRWSLSKPQPCDQPDRIYVDRIYYDAIYVDAIRPLFDPIPGVELSTFASSVCTTRMERWKCFRTLDLGAVGVEDHIGVIIRLSERALA